MTDLTNYSEKQTGYSGVTEKVRAVMIAIKQQWPHAEVDMRDPAGVWSNAINPLSTQQISYGVKKLASITDRYPINAAQFAAYAKAMPYAEKPKPALPVGEKDVARRATFLAYASRCNNRGGVEVPQIEISYHGEFDYQGVANSAVLPEIGNHNHKRHWHELARIFDEEWAKASAH